MKVKDLICELKGLEDYDISNVCVSVLRDTFDIIKIPILGVLDVSHSDKSISLDGYSDEIEEIIDLSKKRKANIIAVEKIDTFIINRRKD
jgi:hypothetical protein